MIWLTNVFRLKSLSCHSAFPTVSELEKRNSQIAYSTRYKQLFSPCRWKPSVIAVTRCIATAVCSYFGLCAVWKKCFASRSRRLTISLHPLRIISHLWSEMICCVIRIAPTGERYGLYIIFRWIHLAQQLQRQRCPIRTMQPIWRLELFFVGLHFQ